MPSASDEEDGFPIFVQQHWRSLNRTAFLLTGDRGQAEDLVQSALEKVHRHWSRVSRMDSPSDYVRRAMVTTAISWRRRRSYGEIPSLSVDPGTQDPYERIDQRAQLVAALRRLPAKMRAALVLRYFEDLPEAEVAAAQGTVPGALWGTDLQLLLPAQGIDARPIAYRLTKNHRGGLHVVVIAPEKATRVTVTAEGGKPVEVHLSSSGMGMTTIDPEKEATATAYAADGSEMGSTPVRGSASFDQMVGDTPGTRIVP